VLLIAVGVISVSKVLLNHSFFPVLLNNPSYVDGLYPRFYDMYIFVFGLPFFPEILLPLLWNELADFYLASLMPYVFEFIIGPLRVSVSISIYVALLIWRSRYDLCELRSAIIIGRYNKNYY